MSLIKCPECGKEISDQSKKCPNCGYPLKKELIGKGKLHFGKKAIAIIAGIIIVICCAVFIGIYRLNHIKVDDDELAVYDSIMDIKNELLDPDSLIVYEAASYYYDPNFEKLRYINDDLPENFKQQLIEVYLHIGAKNSYGGMEESEYVFAFDRNRNLVAYSSDSEAMLSSQYTNLLFDDESFICAQGFIIKNQKVYNGRYFETDDIEQILEKNVENKKVSVNSKYDTEIEKNQKEDLLYSCIDDALYNDDVAAASFYANRFTDDQKDEAQKRIDQYYYDKGIEELDSKNYDEARKFFEQANEYSNTVQMIKKSYYDEAQDLEKESPSRYGSLAYLYEQAGDYEDAEEKYKTAKKAEEYDDMVKKVRGNKDDLESIKSYFEENSDYDNGYILKTIDHVINSGYLGDWVITSTDGFFEKYLRITMRLSSDLRVLYEVEMADSIEKLDNDRGESVASGGVLEEMLDGTLVDDTRNTPYVNISYDSETNTLNCSKKSYRSGFSFSVQNSGSNYTTYTATYTQN